MEKCLIVELGNGGAKLGRAMALKLGAHQLRINTSEKELYSIAADESEKITYLRFGDTEGAGKDRTVSRDIYRAQKDTILKAVESLVIENEALFVFVTFAVGGGTGSGIGPQLSVDLNTTEFLENIIVFGVPALPDFNDLGEGKRSYVNTIAALQEIEYYAEKMAGGAARYIPVVNSFSRGIDCTTAQYYEHINEEVADLIDRYINKYGEGGSSTLDRADRLVALSQMGLHAFGTIGIDDKLSPSPFTIPNSSEVKIVTYEIQEGRGRIAQNNIMQEGNSVLDSIVGYYKEDMDIEPIVAFSGFKASNQIAEKYRSRLDLLDAAAKKVRDNTVESGTGLSDVKQRKRDTVLQFAAMSVSKNDTDVDFD